MTDENTDIENLILAGGIEIAGVDENGEPLYQFTPKMKNINRQLYDMHLNFVNAEIMGLWELGFIEMDLFSEQPIVKLTAKAFSPDDIFNLSKQQQWSLTEIKRLLLDKEV